MRKLFTIFLLFAAVAGSSTAFGQAVQAADPKDAAQIIAFETAGWDAWKRQDKAWFEANLPADYRDAEGGKAEFVEGTVSGAVVKSVALTAPKVTLLAPNVALLTYGVSMDAKTKEGKAYPAKRISASNYVRRAGKWVMVFNANQAVTQ